MLPRTHFDAQRGSMLNFVLTSFLSWGKRKGSLTLSPDTIVRTGSKQRKIAPMISIFPSLGSTGSVDRNFPDYILKGVRKIDHINNSTQLSNKASQIKAKRLTKICQIFLLI